MRIQHKCLVPIYVFPEMKLLFPKQKYNVMSPSSYTARYLYISRIGLHILHSATGNYADRSWEYIHRSQTHECGNWDQGREIPEKEFINGIFLAVYCILAYFSIKCPESVTCLKTWFFPSLRSSMSLSALSPMPELDRQQTFPSIL
jgi:hypothetical protein